MIPKIKEKKCNKCNIIKPLNDFSFEKAREIFNSRCKSCLAKIAKEKRAEIKKNKDDANGVVIVQANEGCQICTNCNIEKLLKDFSFEKNVNRYRIQCKVCRNSFAKERRDIKKAEKEESKKLLPKPLPPTEKECNKCCITKSLDEFYGSGKPGKISAMCKICRSEYYKDRRKTIPKKHIIKEDIIDHQVCNFCSEDKPIGDYLRNDNGSRRKECRTCRKKRAQANTVRINLDPELRKAYNIKKQAAARALLENHPEKKLIRACRKRLADTFKSGKEYPDLIGCSAEFLKKWFEFHFSLDSNSDITFSNHGYTWHIDHVIPCAIYDFKIEVHKQQCFHWSNINPLLIEQNLEKGNRICLTSIETQNRKLQLFCEQEGIPVVKISLPENLQDTLIAGTSL